MSDEWQNYKHPIRLQGESRKTSFQFGIVYSITVTRHDYQAIKRHFTFIDLSTVLDFIPAKHCFHAQKQKFTMLKTY